MDILRDSQLVIFSPSSIIYNTFLQNAYRFSLENHTKFAAAKTGSRVGFLRLTSVRVAAGHALTLLRPGFVRIFFVSFQTPPYLPE